MLTTCDIPTFNDYDSACQYVKFQVKKQGQKYYCSEEYKLLAPVLKQMYQESKTSLNDDRIEIALAAMESVDVNFGDYVEWHNVGFAFSVSVHTGKVINRNGAPYVKLDSPFNGKKSCRWHKGFLKPQASIKD